MEAAGRKFYNSNGTEQDCMLILKNLGMNTIRLRAWVNPASGWSNKADLVSKALRAKNFGLRVMIDFHYSDTWADPGHQTKPAAWTSQDFATLKMSLSNHTTDVLNELKNNGAKWDVVGMSLYPTAGNWSTLNSQCLSNMNDMVTRYNKEVIVVEVGMSWDQPGEENAFLSDLIAKTKLVTGNKGLGVLYWEPESYNNWQGYTLGAFDNSGKPTVALNAFN